MSGLPNGVLVGWCGDDFTGSAAVMEVMAFAGLPAVLFLDIPSAAQLARFPDMRGIGIATTARSHGPAWMERHLPPVFDWLAGLKAPVTHYKICSTLDSAPQIGSVGKAIDLAQPLFGGWVPCMVAAPAVRRYQAFGHLFAGTPQGVFRLDRHPVMAKHPVTPMTESDVARHLSQQTQAAIGLLDLEALHGAADAALEVLRQRGSDVIAIDTVSAADEQRAGQLIWDNRGAGLFAVGSQGLEYALVSHWRAAGLIGPPAEAVCAGAVERMVVVSGSVSPITAGQIGWAERNGFEAVTLDVAALIRGKPVEAAALEAALALLDRGLDPVICTARGPEDPAVGVLRQAIADCGLTPEAANMAIGKALGRLLSALLRRTGIRRAVISGGDTSGHACRELDIFAFTALAPTLPGAALLQAHSERAEFDGLQLALKGGQMGSEDFFGWIKRGGDVQL